jgi:5-formyltetrahydrofolate cyclo-ligase
MTMTIGHSFQLEEQKKQIRKNVKAHKSTLQSGVSEKASFEIFSKVELLPQFESAITILAYWSLPDEVITHAFIEKWYQKKKILLPLVVGSDLELRQYAGSQCMVKGQSFGIMEPTKGPFASIDDVDLAIIPGIAFDPLGNRLGRGKGYYDKLLQRSHAYKVGICFFFQLFPSIPVDYHDIPMDQIIYA